MVPTIIFDFLGLIISTKIDSNSNFLIFKSLRVLYDKLYTMAVRIIWIWKWTQNFWQKPCHTWIWISLEQKMVETSCKKCENKEELHTDYFHFTQITDKNSQFYFRNWRFSTFTMFSLHSWSSVDAEFCISSANVTSGTKQSFWFYNIPPSGGLNRKNT